jgi:serine/threonine protein kinase/Tol biopolymer transport system component
LTPERWAQIEEVFHRAAESDPQRRTALLEVACGNDTELRQQVEELLAFDTNACSNVRAAVRTEFTHVAFSLRGKTVSHYRILEGMDGGGMGVVYRAEDLKLGRQVAIKFLPEESTKDPVSLGRFEREARAASALEHPNICPIYEFGEHEGRPFLVMQLLEGRTLRELIAASDNKKGPFELNVLLDLAIQILDGLYSAHCKGIVHRDIKPANIFVTTQGQAKILDFGLAKLTQNQSDDDAGAAPGATAPKAAADLFLSRTGVAMGTVGYMSPEQVRGEKLDARTDLFSFGLVLYEMTTGKRAFAGETGPLLQDAILNRTPAPAREANPAFPATLERIINKALEKSRQSRYQTASEIRADLQKLEIEAEQRRSRLWLVLPGVALCIAIAVLWAIRRQPQSQPLTPEIRMRQLTANPNENPPHTGAISPDGKYLAYTDAKGLHIKLLDTGELRDVLVPDEAKDQKLDWTCGAWFSDSTRFLANTLPSEKNLRNLVDGDATIWLVSVEDRLPRKVRIGFAWAISPDGSSIGFAGNIGRLGPREIWLMDANGQHARKLFESGDESGTFRLSWTSDGRRVTYTKQNDEADELQWISRDLEGGPPVVLKLPAVKNADFGAGALELGDGRMIFSASTPDTPDRPCNFWVMHHNLRTGEIVVQPRRLTNWTGFCMWPTSVTADRKKVVFTENRDNSTIYTGELSAGGGRLMNPHQFTSIGSWDWPCDWTPDGKALVVRSNRDGVQGIYKQSLDGAPPKLLVADEKFQWQARVSPDGKWLLYSRQADTPSSSWWLMRVPINGGAAQPVFALPYRDYGQPSCPRLRSGMCVLFQRTDDGKELVVTPFDPIKGPGKELTRIPLDPTHDFQGWVAGGMKLPSQAAELSPDGKRIALAQNTNRVKVLSLRGELLREINVRDWRGVNSPAWTSDGRALIVSAGRSALLRISLEDQIQTLLDSRGLDAIVAFPSPDGRHLAIMSDGRNKNIWMMENF